MKSESMWKISVEDHELSKPVLDYIIEQANYLSKDTEGKVKAVLAPAGSSWKEVIKILSVFSEEAYRTTHHTKAHDASALYNKNTYEFYIVDEKHNYELSVFQITCNDTLPATLSVEPVIAAEAGLDKEAGSASGIEVNSLNEFKYIFADIVGCNKVSYIIDRLMKMHRDDENTSKDNDENEEK